MADVDKLIGFMAIMQVPFMNDPDALAYIEEVKTVLKQAKAQEQGWISVKDRLPDKQETYLVFRKEPYGMITIAWYSGHENGWLALDGGFYADGVLTHYMPLPDPPKEGT